LFFLLLCADFNEHKESMNFEETYLNKIIMNVTEKITEQPGIAAFRLRNHLLASHSLKTPREVVAWMGGSAGAGLHYGMAKWAVGVRLPGVTGVQVEEALNSGEIIRTHILRPTWHIVAAEDVHWMMQLTAPRIKPVLESSDKRDTGLPASLLLKSMDIILRALQDGKHLTRVELCRAVNEAGVALDSRQAAHVMHHAELDRLVCSGSVISGKQTYRLLSEVVPAPASFDKDGALAKLAARYFRSHGPATLSDFTWWSGLTANEARSAVEFIRPDFVCGKIDGQEYIYPAVSPGNNTEKSGATFLLPAFDEFLVGYRDRKETLAAEHYSKVISSNGIFKPFILHNAKAVGTWKKLASKSGVQVNAEYFSPPAGATLQKAVSRATAAFEKFHRTRQASLQKQYGCMSKDFRTFTDN
jgi:hypothetical protein